MFRKPISILLLSILFIISPFVILVLNAAINMVPIYGYGSILFRLRSFDIVILCLYLITGVSIFFVKKWGWWVIVISALIMILYNLITLFLNPFASLFVILLMNLVIFSVTLFFFRKHMIAPYFNRKLRWWEQDQRYKIDIYLKFLGIDKNVIISDISEGGCYIFVDFLIEKGSRLPLLIVCGSFCITINAKVMRIARESERYYGYGLMFLKIESVEKEGLKKLLKKLNTYSTSESDIVNSIEMRTSTRFFIANDLSISSEEESCPANLSDISRSGCSVYSSIEINTGRKCLFHFRIGQDFHSIPAKVVWKKKEPDSKQYGLKFIDLNRSSKSSLSKLMALITKLGAEKRGFDKDDYNKRCNDELERTPYIMVESFKNIIKKISH